MMWNYDDRDRWGMMHDQAGAGAGWFMVLLMLVVVLAVVVAVFALLRGVRPAGVAPQAPAARASDPRAILQDRLARGEIDEQDYRSRIGALDDTSG